MITPCGKNETILPGGKDLSFVGFLGGGGGGRWQPEKERDIRGRQ